MAARSTRERSHAIMSETDPGPDHYRFPGLIPWIRYRGPFLAFLMLCVAPIWATVLVMSAIEGEPVGEIAVTGLWTFLLMCFVLTLLFIFMEVLEAWTSPYIERRWLALEQRSRNLAKEPFHDEQQCKVSATEAVWVR